MIKLEDCEVEGFNKDGTRNVKANLIADTSIEVEDIGTSAEKVIGLNKDDHLTMGSTCFTTEMEFGILNSAGNWRFQ